MTPLGTTARPSNRRSAPTTIAYAHYARSNAAAELTVVARITVPKR
jgi:hypothetical protein